MVFGDISSPSIQGLNNMHQKMNEEIMINTRTPVIKKMRAKLTETSKPLDEDLLKVSVTT